MIVSYSKEELWPVYMLSENVDLVFVIDIPDELWIRYNKAIEEFRAVQSQIKLAIGRDL